MSTDELLAEALRLTRLDRTRVAEELLSSLGEPDDEVAAAWAVLERLNAAAFLTCALSAWRAGRVDPRTALRADS